MVTVEKLHDVEAAAVDIEVDIPLFKIRRNGFPDRYFRVQPFHRAPGSVADALAVRLRRNEQQIEVAARAVHADDHAADGLTVLHDAVRLPAVDGVFDRLARNDLAVFFKVIVAAAELFQRAVVERFLIVKNELFPVVGGQCRENNTVQNCYLFLRKNILR